METSSAVRFGYAGSLALVGVTLLALACGEESTAPPGPGTIDALPRELSLAERDLIAADNAFGLKLFREIHALADEGENLFISPLSVALALTLTYNGAEATTAEAFRETLEQQGLAREAANESYRGLIELLSDLDSSVTFLLANSIWYRKGLPVQQPFLDVNRQYLSAEVEELDFSSQQAAPTINGWVEDQTEGLIGDMVPDPIDPNTVMILLNAIYFKGEWATQFDKTLTSERPFRLAAGGTVSVPMMTYPEELEVRHYRDEVLEAADLPYGGGAYSMLIVLPVGDADVGSLLGWLDGERWAAVVDGLAPAELNVVLPKFELEYELTMNDVLTALGLGIAFGGGANFDGICPSCGLSISLVLHKSYVRVYEEGTTAAAATMVMMDRAGGEVFEVDRPFIFAIRERYSGTILFLGLVQDPS